MDTHTLLWALSDQRSLSPIAREIIASPDYRKCLNLASVWEIAIKRSLGKLAMPVSLQQAVLLATGAGVRLEPIELEQALAVEFLPMHHRDPFDRLLVAYCLRKNAAIVGADQIFESYGVQRLW